jgi:hypothetical protein
MALEKHSRTVQCLTVTLTKGEYQLVFLFSISLPIAEAKGGRALEATRRYLPREIVPSTLYTLSNIYCAWLAGGGTVNWIFHKQNKYWYRSKTPLGEIES